MDFSIYCEDILIPFLDMIIDLYLDGTIDYQNAIRLGNSMCDIKQCLYDKEIIDLNLSIVEEILEEFMVRLKKGKVK